MEHLVYADKKANELSRILDGTKTMIIRGAAGRKVPYGKVFEGETLYFIENDGSGLIKAKAIVRSVFNSDKMTVEESKLLISDYQEKLKLTDVQRKKWGGKKYLCFIEISGVEEIEPLIFAIEKNMDNWIIVDDIHTIVK